MTEKEKMNAGEWYDPGNDKELVDLRRKAEQLAYDFNNARPHSNEQTNALKELLQKDDVSDISVLAPVYFDYGKSYTRLGKGTFVNHGCYFMDGGTITIGENVFIGPFCGFYTANHPLDRNKRNQGMEIALPIKIGDSCWFGANVSVMPGVTIGSNCVIAAGSVVTSDIPNNSLVAGVPAKVKKTLSEE